MSAVASMPSRERTVLVTGAGRGIGRAIAVRFAADGARVALAGRSLDQLEDVAAELRTAGAEAFVVGVDVRDPQSTQAMADAVVDRWGAVDVLVANSGVAGPTAPLWELSPQEWDETHAVNVRGVFLSCRAVLPRMIERGAGAIVVIGSMTGKRPLVNRSPYASSKTALIGLIRTLAWEVGPHGVRVNMVSPGPVSGARLDSVFAAAAESLGRPVTDVRDEYLSNSPLRRLVSPDQVADAVAYLADDRSAAITGEDVNVSAGATMY